MISHNQAVALQPDTEDLRVVAIVASAGGVQAVSELVGSLPEGFPAAVLVLIHTDPEGVSFLPEILNRRCALPVVVAEHLQPLRPGVVQVAPPGQHLVVTPDHQTVLFQSGAYPPGRPSADLLLTTMAVTLGPRAIVVVLSGGGHDAATGATAIRRLGGVVLASDEATSEHFSMPLATIERDDAINRVLPLDAIGPMLTQLVIGVSLEAS